MVATRSGTSAAGINLPPVHGAQKGIDPTLKPESVQISTDFTKTHFNNP